MEELIVSCPFRKVSRVKIHSRPHVRKWLQVYFLLAVPRFIAQVKWLSELFVLWILKYVY